MGGGKRVLRRLLDAYDESIHPLERVCCDCLLAPESTVGRPMAEKHERANQRMAARKEFEMTRYSNAPKDDWKHYLADNIKQTQQLEEMQMQYHAEKGLREVGFRGGGEMAGRWEWRVLRRRVSPLISTENEEWAAIMNTTNGGDCGGTDDTWQ
eukprot:1178816-Prorocentrum_minimum.AAC.2